MYSLPVFALMAVASASTMMEVGQLASHKALAAIMERQIRFCSPVSPGANLCARSCGAGYVSCVSATTCYNPGMGQTCCSNGKYCDAGEYCTDGGCCPEGRTLAQCRATTTLSIIPPPAPDATGSPSSSSEAPSSAAPTTRPTTSSKPPSESTTSKPPTASTPSPVVPRPSGNGTSPTPPPVLGGAAQAHANVLVGLGGLGAALMLL